ncbi:MAG: EAL domain-containing protein [Pseudohongiellaceae bacterium]
MHTHAHERGVLLGDPAPRRVVAVAPHAAGGGGDVLGSGGGVHRPARGELRATDIQSHTIEKLILESNLRHAVERDELKLHYQAKADRLTGRIRGVEALLRWDNPTLGKVMPAQFIPVLEEMGHIIATGKWVIRHACLQICE